MYIVFIDLEKASDKSWIEKTNTHSMVEQSRLEAEKIKESILFTEDMSTGKEWNDEESRIERGVSQGCSLPHPVPCVPGGDYMELYR